LHEARQQQEHDRGRAARADRAVRPRVAGQVPDQAGLHRRPGALARGRRAWRARPPNGRSFRPRRRSSRGGATWCQSNARGPAPEPERRAPGLLRDLHRDGNRHGGRLRRPRSRRRPSSSIRRRR
jgi:hypothetical protein